MHLMSMPPTGGMDQQKIIKLGDQSIWQPRAQVTGWAADAEWPGLVASNSLQVQTDEPTLVTITVSITTPTQLFNQVYVSTAYILVGGVEVHTFTQAAPPGTYESSVTATVQPGDLIRLDFISAYGSRVISPGTFIDVTPV